MNGKRVESAVRPATIDWKRLGEEEELVVIAAAAAALIIAARRQRRTSN